MSMYPKDWPPRIEIPDPRSGGWEGRSRLQPVPIRELISDGGI